MDDDNNKRRRLRGGGFVASGKGDHAPTPMQVLSSPEKTSATENARSALHKMLNSLFDNGREREHFLSSVLRDLRECNGGRRDEVALAPVQSSNVNDGSRAVVPATPSIDRKPSAVPFNPKAFNNPTRKDSSSRQAKNRLVNQLDKLISSCGNQEQQLLVPHDCMRNKPSSEILVQTLSMYVDSELGELKQDGLDVVSNLKGMFELASDVNTNNQVVALNAFQRSVMMAIAPIELPAEKEKRDRLLPSIARHLGLSSYGANRLLEIAVSDRQAVVGGDVSRFVKTYKRRNNLRCTKDLISSFHNWLYHDCDETVVSPHSKDTKSVVDILTGLKSQQQKCFCVNGVSQMPLEAGKPVEQGGFDGPRNEGGELLMSDTMIGAMLPANLSKMTNSQMDLCGCENCCAPKKMIESLHSRISRLMKNNPTDSKLSSDELKEVKEFFFTDYESRTKRYESVFDLVKEMTCDAVIDDETFHFGCALDRCNDCPDLLIPQCSLDDEMRVAFATFDCHSFCKIHKSSFGAPSNCPHCADNDTLDDRQRRRLFSRKKHVTQRNETMKTFLEEFLMPALKDYRRHIVHVILLGKNYCIKQRQLTFEMLPCCLMILRDFADALTCTFNNQFQSTHFGENASINFEGIAAKFKEEEQQAAQEDEDEDSDQKKYQCEWHAFISDGSQQDARTCCANTDRLLTHFLRDRQKKLFPDDTSMFFDQSDGKSAQYRSGTSLKPQASLSVKCEAPINKMVTAPHHGKGDCDSQGGADKTCLKQSFRDIATMEKDDDRKMSSATVNEQGNRVSLAGTAVERLSDPKRINGVKGYGKKHQKREAKYKIDRRTYHLMDHGTTDHEKNTHIHLSNTKYCSKGFKSKKGEKHNGLGAMHHLYTCPQLGPDSSAVRRIPCSCDPCITTLNKQWEPNVAPADQPRFQRTPDCDLGAALDGYNDWMVLTLAPEKREEQQQEEIEELCEDILSEFEANVVSQVQMGQFAAYEYNEKDKCCLVRWSSSPMPHTAELGAIEGTHIVEPGAMVIKGYYYENPGRAKQWHMQTRPKKERIFRARYVPMTGLKMEDQKQKKFPLSTMTRKDRKKALKMNPMRASDESNAQVLAEMAKRARIDYEENTQTTEDKSDEENESDGESDLSGEESGDEESEMEQCRHCRGICDEAPVIGACCFYK